MSALEDGCRGAAVLAQHHKLCFRKMLLEQLERPTGCPSESINALIGVTDGKDVLLNSNGILLRFCRPRVSVPGMRRAPLSSSDPYASYCSAAASSSQQQHMSSRSSRRNLEALAARTKWVIGIARIFRGSKVHRSLPSGAPKLRWGWLGKL